MRPGQISLPQESLSSLWTARVRHAVFGEGAFRRLLRPLTSLSHGTRSYQLTFELLNLSFVVKLDQKILIIRKSQPKIKMVDGIETRSERRKALGIFTGRYSLKTLRRLSLVTVAYVLLSLVGFSYSQGSGSGLEPDNVTNLTDVCPMNLSCSELSPQCITCDFNTNCKYGMETNVTCSPRETVECEVGVKFFIPFSSLISLSFPPSPPSPPSHSRATAHSIAVSSADFVISYQKR